MRVRKTQPTPKPAKPVVVEDDGAPLEPIPEPPLQDDMHIVCDKRPRTTAEALLDGLRANGFKLRMEDDKLIVSPLSKLTPLQREAIKGSKEEIKAILAWEAAEPPATENAMEAWYRTLDKEQTDMAMLRSLSRNAKQRRIVLLDGEGAIECVIVNPVAAEAVHAAICELVVEHPGRTLAAEWLGPRGWIRWLTIGGER